MIRKHFAKYEFNQEVLSHSYSVDEIIRKVENKSANTLYFSFNSGLFKRDTDQLYLINQ